MSNDGGDHLPKNSFCAFCIDAIHDCISCMVEHAMQHVRSVLSMTKALGSEGRNFSGMAM